MQKLLVIDDEPGILFSVHKILSTQCQVLTAGTAEEGLQSANEERPDVILLDICLGSQSGLDVFRDLRKVSPRSQVIFITGHGTADTAIEAMKLGAFDYLTKPVDLDQLQQIVGQAFEICRLMNVPAVFGECDRPQDRPDILVGSGPQMQSVFKQIGRIAPQDINVLILGESGTGKELVARAIYHHSRRHDGPFLAINCAAIPESLLESELFGHERGAFTGAEHRRIGKFEQCNNGTLFLDEVADMPLSIQAKMLRLLQEGQFERLGGSETIYSDVRILAATNQDLEGRAKQERFRADLYFRLRGVTIAIPPLRDRKEDIPELAHHFLFRFNRLFGKSAQSISMEALKALKGYSWPGNVRELQSAVRAALIASAGPVILPDFLPQEVLHSEGTGESVQPATGPAETPPLAAPTDPEAAAIARMIDQLFVEGDPDAYRTALARFDRIVLQQAMDRTQGHQARAAELLGMARVTLRAKLRNLKMAVKRNLALDDE
ncbi:MAG: sigma-54-dependent Fis family transcriptional regulator [Planctomycetes bacterium]|nr:sigma-54-dependent Fis family transcriptional regulator [Planctomycetota bacterium]